MRCERLKHNKYRWWPTITGINNLMARLLNVLVRPHSYLCSCCSNLSNFNYKLQVGSDRQHLALYMDRHLRSIAIMIEVASRHTECTHFNLDLQSDATCCETMVLSSLAALFYKKKACRPRLDKRN